MLQLRHTVKSRNAKRKLSSLLPIDRGVNSTFNGDQVGEIVRLEKGASSGWVGLLLMEDAIQQRFLSLRSGAYDLGWAVHVCISKF